MKFVGRRDRPPPSQGPTAPLASADPPPPPYLHTSPGTAARPGAFLAGQPGKGRDDSTPPPTTSPGGGKALPTARPASTPPTPPSRRRRPRAPAARPHRLGAALGGGRPLAGAGRPAAAEMAALPSPVVSLRGGHPAWLRGWGAGPAAAPLSSQGAPRLPSPRRSSPLLCRPA